MIFCKTKFLISRVAAWDHSSESREIVFLFKSLMRWRSQIWWDDVFVKFDEMTFFSSSLIRRRFLCQIWWIALIKFDESFVKFNEISHQARRLIINVARQLENRHTSLDNREWACVTRQDENRRSEKLTMRWLSMITRMNHLKHFLQKTNLNRIFQSTFHTSRQNVKHVISILSQQWLVYRISSNRAKKEDCCERKSL